MTELVRGEIVLADLDPVAGREQAKKRPCVVLSNTAYNARSPLVVVVPVTSKIKGYPFEVEILAGEIRGAALVDQVRAIDHKARRVEPTGANVSHRELHLIQAKLDALLFR